MTLASTAQIQTLKFDSYISGLKEPISAKSFSPEPFIINIPGPGKAEGSLIIPEDKKIAIRVNDVEFPTRVKGKVVIFNYETGELQYTFECENCIMDLDVNDDILFVQLYNTWDILAWNWKTGEKVKLPKEWNRIDKMSFGEKFTAHNNYEDVDKPIQKQKPIDLYISDPKTLEPKKTIKTNLFSLYAMAIKDSSLYVMGKDGNASYSPDSDTQSACVMKYENPLSQEPTVRKISFIYNANYSSNNLFKIGGEFISSPRWYPSVNYIFDAESLTPLMVRNSNLKESNCALTRVFNNTAVVFDDTSMEVYRKGETNFESVKKIEWSNNDAGSSIEIFSFSNETVIAEGYKSGIVRLRNAQTFNIMLELAPVQNMSHVCQTRLKNNKLLIHYLSPSKEGTLAVLWDLGSQKPLLFITMDSLKNKDGDQYDNSINFVNDDIIVRCENQVFIYAGVLS